MTCLGKLNSSIVLAATLLCCPHVGFAGDRQVQSLDGSWQIVFDPSNEGRGRNWFREADFPRDRKQEIAVPSCWELIEKDYEGVAFYRRSFEVPESWKGKVIRLQFDAVNYLTEVWLNDEVVGFHEGGFTPFEFRVDNLIKAGQENRLILRVVGPIILQPKQIDGIGPLETPQWRGGITGGIWQSVRLVATGETFVQDVFIEPKIVDDSATFHLELENTSSSSKPVRIATTIRSTKDPERIAAHLSETISLRPGVTKHISTLNVPDAKHWSPQDPHLYRAEIRLDQSDRWTTRFGMREFTIRGKQFQLNGEPIYVKATFFEGLYPNGIASPDDREMAALEIQLAKDAGFNMIRPWRRPPAKMWLDFADEMGVLVVGSPALECMRLPLSTPYLPSRVEHQIRQTVLRDRNRACVVQWELFNELHRPILKQMMGPMALLTRELDPTRLVLDESGGWAFGARMYLPGQFEPARFNDIHNYPGPFINNQLFNGFLSIGMTDQEKKAKGFKSRTPGRNVVPGLMSFVSELGYGSLPNLVENNERFRRDGNPLTPAYRYHHRLEQGQKRVLKESGFNQLYPDFEQFCLDQQAIHGAANKRMIEAVRCNPRVNGYCIHALAAGDWILGAGLIDLWRQPKSYAYEATKAANQPRIIVIRSSARNVYATRGTKIELIGINDQDALNAQVTVQVVSDSGTKVSAHTIDMAWKPGVSTLYARQLETRDLRGGYTINVIVSSAEGTVVTNNAYDFDVFSDQDLVFPKSQIAVLDLDGTLTRFLESHGVSFVEFDASTTRSTPVFVTSANPNSPEDRTRFANLSKFIEQGGTAVYIQGIDNGVQHGDSKQVRLPAIPIAAQLEPARGLWTCIPHLVHDHPIFDGLPTGGMMRDIYGNVWATQTIRDLPGQPVVASIAYRWFSQDHKQHYAGPGESWWGSDMAVVTKGKGRVVVSQLRIIENLGSDPVADKPLQNLIRFCHQSVKPSH